VVGVINILAVDDGGVLDAAILARFSPESFHWDFVADVAVVQHVLQSVRFDLLLLSTHLDHRDFCRRLRADPLTATLPIVTLSRCDDLEEKLRYYQMGTDDFLTLPFDGRELVARIHAVLRRAQRRSQLPAVLSAAGGLLELDIQRKTVNINSVEVHLTRLEYLLLHHLIRLAGNYVSTEELLEAVWGYTGGTGDPALVRAQIKNLRRKLQTVDHTMQWLRSMPGLGYQIAA